MACSAGLYLVVFWLCQALLNCGKNYFLSPSTVDDWLVLLVTIILGCLFIADSIITSYLKTPLQRLAMKIEYSDLLETQKKKLLQATQEANELFKETFKKFGLLALPSLLVGLIDNQKMLVVNEAGELIGQVIKDGRKNSEKPIFYLCYLIPILYASWKIVRISQELKKLAARSDFSKG
jgi:hypothetical protein